MRFFFLNIEETSNVLDYLFVRKGHFITCGTVWGRRGNDVGGAVDTIGRRQRARWNKDGGGQARHCWDGWAVMWYVKGKK